MKKTLKMAAMAIAVLVAASSNLGAQDAYIPIGPPGALFLGLGMGGLGISLPVLLRAVNPTPDQKAKIDKVMSGNRAAFMSLYQKLHKAQQRVSVKLFAPGNLDMNNVGNDVQEVANLQMKLLHEALDSILEIRAILTPEQLKKAVKIHQKLQALEAQFREILNMESTPAS